MTYRILVTGSRDWPKAHANTVRDAVHARIGYGLLSGYEKSIVVHGACPSGVDMFAKLTVDWLKLAGATGVDEEPHPANWGKLKGGAGTARNIEMIDLGADICLAFLMPCTSDKCWKRRGGDTKPHYSHGTDHCASNADSAGIPLVKYRLPDLDYGFDDEEAYVGFEDRLD